MKRVILTTVTVLLLASSAAADSFRFGTMSRVEMVNQPTYETVLGSFDDEANAIPGFCWEVLTGHIMYRLENNPPAAAAAAAGDNALVRPRAVRYHHRAR